MFDIKAIKYAKTIEEAKSYLLSEENPMIFAGGSDILIALRGGKLLDKTFISIDQLSELKNIEIINGDIYIGALCTMTDIMSNSFINKNIPFLFETLNDFGGAQVRNVATVGGNICNGVPSADSAMPLFCLNAKVIIDGQNGIRQVNIEDFYQGFKELDLEKHEIVTKLLIKKEDYVGFTGSSIKYGMREAMDIAIVGCSTFIKMDNGLISDVRITFAVAAPTPKRCKVTESKVIGLPVNDETMAIINKGVIEETTPRKTWDASIEFRQHIMRVISRRTFNEALLKQGVENNDNN